MTTPIKKINITGVDTDSLLKLDLTASTTSNNLSYTECSDTKPAVDDTVKIQGLEGVVTKTSTSVSSGVKSNSITAEVGSLDAKKYIAIVKSSDEVTYKPYLISDIVAAVALKSGLAITYKGYDLCIESYKFSGFIIDCLNDIANLVYGYVVYKSVDKSFIIVAGDTSNSNNINHVIEDSSIIAYELYTEKLTDTKNLGLALINLAIEMAKLRKSMNDITEEDASVGNDKILRDKIDLEFGYIGGYKLISNDVEVESTAWDIWYEDNLGIRYKNSTFSGYDFSGEKIDPVFTMDQSKFFKEETVDPITTADDTAGGGVVTVTRAKKRGLRSLNMCKLIFRLKNLSSIVGTYGKGYLLNLTTLGMPSLAKYNSTQSIDGKTYKDGYHVLYDVETREIDLFDEELGIVVKAYIPHLIVGVNTQVYNGVLDALRAQKAAKGEDYLNIKEWEINEAMLRQHYAIHMEVMSKDVEFGLKFKGYIDDYGRVIDTTGKVNLIFGVKDGQSAYFYPVEGMDVDLSGNTTTNTTYNNTITVTNSIDNTTTTTANTSILGVYFDEPAILETLKTAFKELVTIATAQTPAAIADSYDEVYPKFLYEYRDNVLGNKGAQIGIIYGKKNYDGELTVNNYVALSRTKKRLERALKALECKINLIVKVIKKLNPTSSLTTSSITKELKNIIEYQAVVLAIKDESLQTLISLRSKIDTSTESILNSLSGTNNSTVNKIAITTPLLDSIPEIGSNITVFNIKYSVKTATVSNLILNITGEQL